MGIREVSPEEYLKNISYDHPVYTHLSSQEYVRHKEGREFEKKDFYTNPQNYESAFEDYAEVTDIFLNCIFWNIHSPAFFSLDDISNRKFRISVIADITCDIAPASSIPTTYRASTIDDPVYGIDRLTFAETAPYQENSIDIMAIDNLPNELPRDASKYFGSKFVKVIIPELEAEHSDIIQQATIAKDGKLMPRFKYLEDYIATTNV